MRKALDGGVVSRCPKDKFTSISMVITDRKDKITSTVTKASWVKVTTNGEVKDQEINIQQSSPDYFIGNFYFAQLPFIKEALKEFVPTIYPIAEPYSRWPTFYKRPLFWGLAVIGGMAGKYLANGLNIAIGWPVVIGILMLGAAESALRYCSYFTCREEEQRKVSGSDFSGQTSHGFVYNATGKPTGLGLSASAPQPSAPVPAPSLPPVPLAPSVIGSPQTTSGIGLGIRS
jgi:hypothetical protein